VGPLFGAAWVGRRSAQESLAITPRAIPFGNYYLLERLAVGGMAEVYLAKCFGVAGFERLVALKRILPTIAEDDEFIAMFIDEAKIAGQLNHANVAQIFDLGKINQSYFIAMEYISGHDLRALWDRVRHDGEGIPIELACYATKKICEGLDYAHRRRDNRGRPLGIIHRDVSPQNVLLSYDGDVKVIDFGIAKAANRMVRTQTGILKGKFAYMAPEQARGEPTDHRSDVFAIGVILYELLTGERAFKAESDFALLEKVRKVDLVPPRKLQPDVPRELERIVYKAMSREAGDRYAWASVMASDLDRFMTNHGLTYNKEELAAYVRKAFKSDYDEEKRRLGVYKGFRLDEEEEASPEEDELEGTLDGTFNGSLEVVSERSEVSPDQATMLRADPSLEDSSEEQEIYEAGTELGDAYDESDDSHAEEADLPSHAESTRMIDDGSFDEETDTSADRLQQPSRGVDHRVATKAVSARSRSLSEEADSLLSGSPMEPDPSLVDAPTRVHSSGEEEAPSHDDSTRVFSQEDDSDEVGSDATMVDSSPLSAGDEDSVQASATHDMPTRAPDPERVPGAPSMRGTTLGDVVGDGDAAAARTPSKHHDVNMFSGPQKAAKQRKPKPPSEPAGTPRPEPEQYVTQSPPPAKPVGAMVAMAFLGFFGGVILAGPLGALVGAALAGPPNTVVTSTPHGAQVTQGGKVVCAKTPCMIDVEPGKHEFVFSLEGYDNFARPQTIIDGSNHVDGPLPRRQTELVLRTDPPGAKVTFNGKTLTGNTPVTLPDITVGDEVKLVIKLKGYDTIDKTVTVPALDAEETWDFDMIASTTTWELALNPPDAVVETPPRTRVREGVAEVEIPHEEAMAVRVVRPGCEPETLSLLGTGKPSEKKDVKLNCRPLTAKLSVKARSRLLVSIGPIDLGRRWLSDYELPEGTYDVTLRSRRTEETARVEIKSGQHVELPTNLRW
jgi:serine/threonine protein kinase